MSAASNHIDPEGRVRPGDGPGPGEGAGPGSHAQVVRERGTDAGAAGDAAGDAVVRASGLTRVFGEGATAVRALDGVDVAFGRGSFTAIMGPSGSGKSTLMHCLAGLDTVTAGTVHLGGVELTALGDRELTRLRRDHIGFVFQSFNLLPTLTARQNILLPLDLAGRRADRAWFDRIVDSLGLEDRLDHRPWELSGGQQQRVAAARAMITRPDVVFADEPTGALDSRTGANLLAWLRRCARELGQTIIMVTHDARAAAHADRALVLADGRIRADVPHPDADTMASLVNQLEG